MNSDCACEPADNLAKEAADVLTTLTWRECKVLELRFGLADGRPRTLKEVGKQFNLGRERIRQIEAKALRKMRHPTRACRLREYLEAEDTIWWATIVHASSRTTYEDN